MGFRVKGGKKSSLQLSRAIWFRICKVLSLGVYPRLYRVLYGSIGLYGVLWGQIGLYRAIQGSRFRV